MAVGTELCGGKDFELHRAAVDHLSAVFFPIDRAGRKIGGDIEFVENLVENLGAARPIHGLGNVSLFNAETGADTPIGVLDAMANDAADSFPGHGETLGVGDEDRLVDRHASHVVAADAKIAVGAIRDAVDALAHRVEDGTELGIGVLRDGPLAVLAGVAFRAERGRGEFVADEEIVVGDDSLGLDVAERAALEPEVGLVLLRKDGALGLDRGRFEFGLALADFVLNPVAGGLEVVAGFAQKACAFPLDCGLAFLDFELGGALEVAHFVDYVGAEPGGEKVELEDFVADLELPVFLDVAEIRRKPEAARGDAGAGERRLGGDGVSDFGGVSTSFWMTGSHLRSSSAAFSSISFAVASTTGASFLITASPVVRASSTSFSASPTALPPSSLPSETASEASASASDRAAAAAASAFSFAVCSNSPASVSTLSIKPGVSASSAAWTGSRKSVEMRMQ